MLTLEWQTPPASLKLQLSILTTLLANSRKLLKERKSALSIQQFININLNL